VEWERDGEMSCGKFVGVKCGSHNLTPGSEVRNRKRTRQYAPYREIPGEVRKLFVEGGAVGAGQLGDQKSSSCSE
jgi:hypothetical protein